MLQEVHCSENTTDMWTCEWGYKTLFSCCSSNKAGVGILFNNNFNLSISKIFLDPNGRFIICDIEADGKPLTLANVYAPNNDDPDFFHVFFDVLSSFKCDEIIIGGDFNLVLDIEKDKKNGIARTHHNALKVVQNAMENLELCDVWRILNPDGKRFTWRQRQPDIHCRLDFFLVSQTTLCNCFQTDIIPGFKTDHSMITLNLSVHSNPRGNGYWKLNTSLLADTIFVEKIKATIEETAKEYESDKLVNPLLLWEMIKLKVRQESISFSASLKREKIKKEQELEKEIASLEKERDNAAFDDPLSQNTSDRIKVLKDELEKIIEYRTKGAILRSKSKWYNEGEKNTKYFLSLEKRHFKQGTISQLKLNDNTLVTSDKDILSECKSFYEHLYASKIENSSNFNMFQQANETVLSFEDQQSCDGILTETECVEALKSMDPDKTPGTDGLPAEFYKLFWNDISIYLLSALNLAYESGCLSVTQKRGIIKLIPKKDVEPFYIKNWRPITLLNTDYKIAAKAIANRIKTVLPKLINNDQTGFMKGRFIGENIRLVDGIIQYAARHNVPGLLLFIDFEKAFDSLEWPFIFDTLRFFGFGPSIINWVRTFYCRIESCILNNGWSSNFFQPQRGVRQGCPLSPYLFILAAEVLAKAIRSNRSIKGFSLDNNEVKLSQYADDTTLILDGSKESLIAALQTFEDFSKVSGLRLNDSKTEALWIGSKIGHEKIFVPGKNLKWPKSKVKALGLWLSTDPDTAITLNYNEKTEKIRKLLSCWKYRRLTLIGKITVLKSLAASQLVYLLAPLHSNHHAIKEINDMFYHFLWNGKGDKIKRKVMINEPGKGGLKMIDLCTFNKSLKTTWVKKYLDTTNNGKWKLLFDMELKKYDCQGFFRCNLNVSDTKEMIKVSDPFLEEILEYWAEINFENQIISRINFQEQALWLNSLIRINNKPILFKDWLKKGVTKVKHLQTSKNNSFLSFSAFASKYNLKLRPLDFCGLLSAVKSLHKTVPETIELEEPNSESFCDKIMKSQRPGPTIYKKLIKAKSLIPTNSQHKWLQDCDNLDDENAINWESAYSMAPKCTKSTKLIEFQFKLLHRRIPTNNFLFKIGKKENKNCTFCHRFPETLIHLFWSCHVTTSFWKGVVDWLRVNLPITNEFTLTDVTALGLRPDPHPKFTLQLNYVFLLARYYIWQTKIEEKPPNFNRFLRQVKSRLQYETKAGDTKKWAPLADGIQTAFSSSPDYQNNSQ